MVSVVCLGSACYAQGSASSSSASDDRASSSATPSACQMLLWQPFYLCAVLFPDTRLAISLDARSHDILYNAAAASTSFSLTVGEYPPFTCSHQEVKQHPHADEEGHWHGAFHTQLLGNLQHLYEHCGLCSCLTALCTCREWSI